MKIATTIGEMYDYASSPAETVKLYQGTGFRYLDYSFYYDHQPGSPFMERSDSFWKKTVSDAACAAEECGFQFVQAHIPGYNPPPGFADDPAMTACCRAVKACGMLGIKTAVLHTSYGNGHFYPVDKAPYFEYNKPFLRMLLDVAEKYDVTLCIENTSTKNMGNCYFPRTPEDMNDLVEFINHPLLKCCWDTGHAVMEEKIDQYEDLVKLASNLRAVHIHDNNGLSDEHLAPFCGKVDMDSVVNGLTAIGFKGFFTFEVEGFLNRPTGSGAAKCPTLEMRHDALKLLFKTGKFILDSHGIFEE